MKNLPQEQVDALGAAYKQAKKGREKERLHALWLLARGYKRREVQEIVGVSKQSLGSWVTTYGKQGIDGMKEKPQPGNHHKLTKEQKETIKELITTKTPEEAGLEGKFWDTEQLKKLVRKKFEIQYTSYSSYYELFKFCGFTYHKPDKVNKKQTLSSKEAFEEKLKKDWRSTARKMGWYW